MFRRTVGSTSHQALLRALSDNRLSVVASATPAPARAASMSARHPGNATATGTVAGSFPQSCGLQRKANGDLLVTFVIPRSGDRETRHNRCPYGLNKASLFRCSPLLLAPSRGSTSTLPQASTHPSQESNCLSPYDISVDSVLMGASGTAAPATLRELAQLLLDPDAPDVEEVSMSSFVAMVPRRQLKALGGDGEWLDAVLNSEHYQACRDARALRLAGIMTVGKWEEAPDRVPISPYSRGLLNQAYQQSVRSRGSTQQEEVLTWLTRAIQRAVAREFVHAAGMGSLPMGGSGSTALPSTPAPAANAVAATTATVAGAAALDIEADIGKLVKREESARPVEGEDADEEATALSHAAAARATAPMNAPTNKSSNSSTTTGANAAWFDRSNARSMGKKGNSNNNIIHATATAAKAMDADVLAPVANDDDDVGAIPEELMEEIIEEVVEEVEEEEDPVAADDLESEKESAEAAGIKTTMGGSSAAKDAKSVKGVKNAEVEQEKKGEKAEENETGEDSAAATITALPLVATAPGSAMDPKLARLASLMLTQFNSADGYLHGSKKELKADENAGFVTFIEDDTAQVDPLALFSAFHNAKVSPEAGIEVRALKQIWNTFNAHQMLMEDASRPADEAFHRQKSVDALVHGALVMRAISREEEVMLDHVSLLPPYGFPLMSSDMRPYSVNKPKASPHTDVSFMTVEVAVKAFRTFFAKKDVCSTPFRPRVDVNAGCGVVMLSGTTLHLYDTSLKSAIHEDQVRASFAEAMLGVLHVCRTKVLPRVNTVHYHIMLTSPPNSSSQSAGGADASAAVSDEIISPTTIINIDMTAPFTKGEKARLGALAEPLGFTADQVAEFNCIEDIVIELEDTTGVSVVHDLLQSRDDLEALLTPTLVELLPDDADVDRGEEDAEEEPAATADATVTHAQDQRSNNTRSSGNKRSHAEDDEEDYELEVKDDNEEDGEDGEEPSHKPIKGRALPPAPPARKGGKRVPPPIERRDEIVEEEVEEDEEDVSSALSSQSANTNAKGSHGKGKLRKNEEEELYRRLLEDESATGALETDADELQAMMEDDVALATPSSRKSSEKRIAAAAARARGLSKRAAVKTAASQLDEDTHEEEAAVPATKSLSRAAATATPSKHRGGNSNNFTGSKSSPSAAAQPTFEEDEEEEHLVEYEEVEEDEEEDVAPPSTPLSRRSAAATADTKATPTSKQQQSSRRQPVNEEVEEAIQEEEEELPPPPLTKSAARKTTMAAAGKKFRPAAAAAAAVMTKSRQVRHEVNDNEDVHGKDDGEDTTEAEAEKWFRSTKPKPKRRYFS